MTLRIVCGIDFSDTSRAALDEAAKLARLLDAELHVVHAYGLPMGALPIDGGFVTGPETAAELASRAEEQIQSWQQAYPDVRLVRHVVVGMPADEILRVAEDVDAAYLVVGTHGRTGLAREGARAGRPSEVRRRNHARVREPSLASSPRTSSAHPAIPAA